MTAFKQHLHKLATGMLLAHGHLTPAAVRRMMNPSRDCEAHAPSTCDGPQCNRFNADPEGALNAPQ